MKIPSLLESVLRADRQLHGAVTIALARFTPWVSQNRLVFFDEYTDHGPSHIETVLRSVAGLIAPTAWETPDDGALVGSAARTSNLEAPFCARDAGTLVLAVLLHDSAMHLTEEGFLSLVDRTRPWTVPDSEFMPPGSEAPWPELWDGFLQQSRRYDEQQLQSLFGNVKPVTRPGPDSQLWTALERKWIGEFLRRHHARLAHEIALVGVPGPGAERITLPGPDDLERWMCDLAGLVARSHNMELRAAVELLPHSDRKNFRGVHVPFLMSLIRIADYVDMDSPRAPRDVLKVRSLRSPISRSEWAKHQATVFVKTAEDDPECIRIDARPENLRTFLALRSLYADIQNQLDQSWAVLGEVYGGDSTFGLRTRRVRSSLDDAAKLRLGFIPIEARLRTTGAGLLRHLVGPLYDEQAAFGIRELVQNAIDACRELHDLREHHATIKGSTPALEADVVVIVEEGADGHGSITVEDRGIGMTPEVVRDYFLVAGASFRDSDAWQEAHVDADGKPRFARAGRFGIGAVAAFLLGNTIEVETRDALQPETSGVSFTCQIEAPLIEMKRKPRAHGTRVHIRVTNPRVFDQLADAESWDWYRMRTPSLLRKLLLRREAGPNRRHVMKRSTEHPPREVPLGTRVTLPSMEILPERSGPTPLPWRPLAVGDGGSDVVWTFNTTYPVTPDDACDGFVLRRPDAWRTGFEKLWPPNRTEAELYLYRPRLCIQDPNKSVAVDLCRTVITRLPFQRELADAVCREVIAGLLLFTESTRPDVFQQLSQSFYRPQPGASGSTLRSLYHPAVSTSPDEHRTKLPGAHSVSWLVLGARGLMPVTLAARIPGTRAFVFGDVSSNRFAAPQYGQTFNVVPEDMQVRAVAGDPRSFFTQMTRDAPGALLMPSHRWADDVRWLPEHAQYRKAGRGWMLVWSGEFADPLLERLVLADAQANDGSVVFAPTAAPAESDPLTTYWLALLGVPEIPLDSTERRLVLGHAFRELAPEIERLEREPSGNPALAG